MDNNKYQWLQEERQGALENFQRLLDIVALLRKECPWDKEQTHKSIKKGFLEEAYEVADAIEKENFNNLKEELGDVLLQVVFHSDLAKEEGEFDISQVLNDICNKMVRRHPHVFKGEDRKTVDKILEKWENIKSQEHGNYTYSQRLEDVPSALPALMKSYKVQKRAKDAGFDWDDISGPLAKVQEELDEFIQAYESCDSVNMDEEIGDLLFSIVNVSRFVSIDPEDALNRSTEKFVKRFRRLEELALSRGQDIKNLTLDELDALWVEIK